MDAGTNAHAFQLTRNILPRTVNAIGGHAKKRDFEVFIPQRAAATLFESIEFDGGRKSQLSTPTTNPIATIGNIHIQTTGRNDAHTLMIGK